MKVVRRNSGVHFLSFIGREGDLVLTKNHEALLRKRFGYFLIKDATLTLLSLIRTVGQSHLLTMVRHSLIKQLPVR